MGERRVIIIYNIYIIYIIYYYKLYYIIIYNLFFLFFGGVRLKSKLLTVNCKKTDGVCIVGAMVVQQLKECVVNTVQSYK